MRSTPRDFNEPFKVADHNWCHVESVEYFIWIKGEKDKAIDMRNGKPEDRAHGTLMPVVRMDEVSKILNRGMAEMRDLFLDFQKKLDPRSEANHSTLQDFVIPPFPVDWNVVALGILTAVDLTAHRRYVVWHSRRFRRAKRSCDSSYEPSESEQCLGDPCRSPT
ncbi:uncharacterized protein EDB93DRAFT_1244762 [Suillus bovinus]|uniref:uncharacterized protein n=1 Tax=Suillus bovinus TaxID=48563 RepID=UPI001B885A77|nr:uncharacterized protein EDB93DRAFT_1244762 [Suillus bovinus]KAG2160001.1 hypothetical protein EDB93DRAFT_1244762 [Suillus bovinus]